ncbi:MAG: hypothetical protein RI885_2757 [Actinomycetota bacterium]
MRPGLRARTTSDDRALRILVIAPLRYPIAEPHAGGLESALWHHVGLLRARGHEVTLCAVEGSDFMEGGPAELRLPAVRWPAGVAASDTDYPQGYLESGIRSLERAMDHVARHARHFDVIDNHCLQGVPLAWARRIGLPMVTNLHTPVLPSLVESTDYGLGGVSRFIAVSRYTADQWAPTGIDPAVIPNAIDTDRWALGAGGGDLVWFGRIVPEKGPHLAIRAAALLGRRIVLAGRVGDPAYAEREVWPLLGDGVDYAGALGQPQLAALVGRSAAALVTPVWDEPFGLVIAEALATGTPVAGFDTGGVPEVVDGSPGASLVRTADVGALAVAAARLMARSTPASRLATREHAVGRFSLEARVDEVERVYRAAMAASHAMQAGSRRASPLRHPALLPVPTAALPGAP